MVCKIPQVKNVHVVYKQANIDLTDKLKIMANFNCEYCGHSYSSVIALTSCSCPRHPLGGYKGNHKLYEGSEKTKYTCKYCGHTYNNISGMTATSCPRHPNGSYKGNHLPAL